MTIDYSFSGHLDNGMSQPGRCASQASSLSLAEGTIQGAEEAIAMHALCELSQRYAPLLGRFLITFIFFRSGFDKITNFPAVAGNMAAKDMPYAEFFLVCAIAIEILGSLCVLLGWKARWGALALLIFLVPATLIFHNFWSIDPVQVREMSNQTNHFFKNLAIMGALVFIMGMGSGPLSVAGDKEEKQ